MQKFEDLSLMDMAKELDRLIAIEKIEAFARKGAKIMKTKVNLKHTPTHPLGSKEELDLVEILKANSFTPQRAAFIVRAVNTHEELLEALYQALPYVEDQLQDLGYKPGAVERRVKFIKHAIDKAEGL